MKLSTPRGEVDTDDLRKTSGIEDSARYFGPWEEYRFEDGEVAVRLEVRDPQLGGFLKIHPWDPEILCEIGGQRTVRRESELVKTVGMTDNANEFSCWVEYRLPESDTIVHRSADVKIKRQPVEAVVTAGSLNSGASNGQ